jgi:hypothetical protein
MQAIGEGDVRASRTRPSGSREGVGDLRRRHLIGNLRKGCKIDADQRVAPLRAPLSGWALFANGKNLAYLDGTESSERSEPASGGRVAVVRVTVCRAWFRPALVSAMLLGCFLLFAATTSEASSGPSVRTCRPSRGRRLLECGAD